MGGLRGPRRLALSDRLASQSGNQVDAGTEILTRTYALNAGCGLLQIEGNFRTSLTQRGANNFPRLDRPTEEGE